MPTSDASNWTLAARLQEAEDSSLGIALYRRDATTLWRELRDATQRQKSLLGSLAGQRVGLAFRADTVGIATFAALESLACDVFLFDADLSPETRASWSEQLELTAVLPDSPLTPPGTVTMPSQDLQHASDKGSVTILTSGTTGRPKAVRHRWQSLSRPVRRHKDDGPPVWLLAFRPHLYAGLQVILQALLNDGTIVVPDSADDPAMVAELMAVARVEYASATPSYWRRLLMSADAGVLNRVPLVQITLGGEAVDQAILDQLHLAFPTARLAHIYATTELGRCFSVTDGQSGFPSALLNAVSHDGVELRIDGDELWVRSSNAMDGYDACADTTEGQNQSDGWFATGDRVEMRGDRVYFVGRNSDLINVGGNKVFPVAVERVIRLLPEVADVRVFGQDSSVAGQLVACQIVPSAEQTVESLRQRVREHCQTMLDRYQCPRIIEIVDRLQLTEAGKMLR